MGYPLNAEVISGIAKGAFFSTLLEDEANRIYPKLTYPITQEDLTMTYASWGAVPEPRQLTSVATTPGSASGFRQMKELKDFKMAVTVAEWEDTVEMPRSIAESYPDEVARKVGQMALKAQLFMDRQFCTAIESTTQLGYDGIALYSTGHNETGSNQDNAKSAAAATGTKPTAAELETNLDINLSSIRSFTDDAGTPVNDGVKQFWCLVPTDFDYLYHSVLNPGINVGYMPIQATDVSGGTGRFRGMIDVLSSAFVKNNGSGDRHYLFAKRPGTGAVALCKNKDWEFKTNVGTDSDLWNLGQKAIFYGYARWIMVPWDWKYTIRQVWT